MNQKLRYTVVLQIDMEAHCALDCMTAKAVEEWVAKEGLTYLHVREIKQIT